MRLYKRRVHRLRATKAELEESAARWKMERQDFLYTVEPCGRLIAKPTPGGCLVSGFLTGFEEIIDNLHGEGVVKFH